MTAHIEWVEAWIDSGSPGDYILLLKQVDGGKLHIIDPQEHGRLVKEWDTYDEAVHWLNEDEFDLMEGRYIVSSDAR